MKLKDILMQRTNKKNNQISLQVKKKKLKEFDIDIDEILNIKLNKSNLKWG